jgi:hypothetical protein
MQRAFVVQLKADCDPPKTLSGRVEHVHSGDSIRFESLEQLVKFLADSIAREKQVSDWGRPANERSR